MVNLRLEPYADENAKLNDWIDRGMKEISWKMFENQEKWVHMSGELGEGRFPQMKSYDEVYTEFNKAFDNWISWLFSYMFERYIRDVRLGNVDLGEDMEYELKDMMGEEYFEEWEEKARQYIFDDYAENLGVERTTELFAEAWPGWCR